MHRTWAAGIGALGKQMWRKICYPSTRRVSKTMLVPRGQILRWLKEAEDQQVKVSEHDLLVAFIFKVSTLATGCVFLHIKLIQCLPYTVFFAPTYPTQIRSSD